MAWDSLDAIDAATTRRDDGVDPLDAIEAPLSRRGSPHASLTQAGRVGTKATKIIRIVRLVRMVRVVKLYRMTGDVDELRRDDSSLEPSSVGKKLTERQTVRLISMMLSMILVLPWLYTDSLLNKGRI